MRGVTVKLRGRMWSELDEATDAVNAQIKDEELHYSRNALIEFILRSWLDDTRDEREEMLKKRTAK